MPIVGLTSTLPSMRGCLVGPLAQPSDFLEIQWFSFEYPLPDHFLTKVADMPGYPTKNALFGGPHTRTNAVMTAQRLA